MFVYLKKNILGVVGKLCFFLILNVNFKKKIVLMPIKKMGDKLIVAIWQHRAVKRV